VTELVRAPDRIVLVLLAGGSGVHEREDS
jgi:hypothetical protein